jgi:hypothetical protein
MLYQELEEKKKKEPQVAPSPKKLVKLLVMQEMVDYKN